MALVEAPHRARCGFLLLLGAKAHAILHGQPHASIEGVRAVASSVLRHRISINFNGQAEGWTTGKVIDKLLETVRPGL